MYRELGPENVSLLEGCPHFRGCYIQVHVPEQEGVVRVLRGCEVLRAQHLVHLDIMKLLLQQMNLLKKTKIQAQKTTHTHI